mgnify:CR=1 FL=1
MIPTRTPSVRFCVQPAGIHIEHLIWSANNNARAKLLPSVYDVSSICATALEHCGLEVGRAAQIDPCACRGTPATVPCSPAPGNHCCVKHVTLFSRLHESANAVAARYSRLETPRRPPNCAESRFKAGRLGTGMMPAQFRNPKCMLVEP